MAISFRLLCLIFMIVRRKEYVKSLIYACTFWTLFVYCITEVLSCFKGVKYVPLFISWVLFDAILLVTLIVVWTKNRRRVQEFNLVIRVSKIKAFRITLYAALCILMIYLACNIVPYNWDSMTYHCARIVNWAQNGTVAHYAASIERQICSPTLTEFVNLNVYVLMEGNDIFFNCIQCVSYLFCVMFVYKIAKRIGCDDNAAIFASILYATAPTCFAEALSTQVDEFAALWMMSYTYMIIDVIYDRDKLKLNDNTRFRMFVIALDIAFGYLTKPTVILAMLIFAIWMIIIGILGKEKLKTIFAWILSVPLMSLVVILPELIRNIATFGAISPNGAGKAQMVGTLDSRYVFVGMLKNLFHNVPSVYWPWANEFVQDIVYWFSYHLGIIADSEVISEGGRSYVLQKAPDYTYDTSVNPIIITLFFICMLFYIISFFYNRKKKKKFSMGYSSFAFLSFIVLCVTARWEMYIARYMVPYFALLCPAIALQIQKMFKYKEDNNINASQYIRGLTTGMIYFMCLVDLIGLVSFHYGHVNKGGDRNQRYFVWNGEEYTYDEEASNLIKKAGYKKIGLNLGCDSYEYPIWKILGDNGYTIKHVNVSNETLKYEDKQFIPDCIIVMDNKIDGSIYKCHGIEYRHVVKCHDKYYFVTK